MNNNEEFVRLWSAIVNSLANSEAHSELRMTTSREEDTENIGRKRKAESMRERKKNRVKRQRVSTYSDKSHKKKQWELIRSKLEVLKQLLTPNSPESDSICILDSAIDYMRRFHLAVFLTVLRNSI